jgi:hypothetical protein
MAQNRLKRPNLKEVKATISGNGREVSPKDWSTKRAYIIATITEGPKAMVGRDVSITLEAKDAVTIRHALADAEAQA